MSTATVAPAIDHSATIRSEVETTVRQLIKACAAQVCQWKKDEWEILRGDPSPRRVYLGYTVNMHRGKDLYQVGDVIEGLTVASITEGNRAIKVEGDEVRLLREHYRHDDGETDWRAASASTTL